MNYENATKFVINFKVAESLGMAIEDVQSASIKSKPTAVLVKDEHGRSREFDPHDNPSDAWPIILENEIDIEWPVAGQCHGQCTAFVVGDTDIRVEFDDKNEVLRTAMICYLKLKETTND